MGNETNPQFSSQGIRGRLIGVVRKEVCEGCQFLGKKNPPRYFCDGFPTSEKSAVVFSEAPGDWSDFLYNAPCHPPTIKYTP